MLSIFSSVYWLSVTSVYVFKAYKITVNRGWQIKVHGTKNSFYVFKELLKKEKTKNRREPQRSTKPKTLTMFTMENVYWALIEKTDMEHSWGAHSWKFHFLYNTLKELFFTFRFTKKGCHFFKWLFFNWRITTLQCCVSSCCTTMWISRKYIYIPSLVSLPPTALVPPL